MSMNESECSTRASFTHMNWDKYW